MSINFFSKSVKISIFFLNHSSYLDLFLSFSHTLIQKIVDLVSTPTRSSSPPLGNPLSDHTSPAYTGPPLSPASTEPSGTADLFVLQSNRTDLQTPIASENQLTLYPESVAAVIEQPDQAEYQESDFASDLASALGGIQQLPYDRESEQESSASTPALHQQSSVATTATPSPRFHPHPGSPANSIETAAPSPVANVFAQAVQLEEGIAYPATDHGRLTGLHTSVASAINLTHSPQVTIDLTYLPPIPAAEQPEIKIVLDCKSILQLHTFLVRVVCTS